MDKYLSIITNFGCHYKCPYCIVRNNGIKVPTTTLDGLDALEDAIKENGANIVSVPGNYPLRRRGGERPRSGLKTGEGFPLLS